MKGRPGGALVWVAILNARFPCFDPDSALTQLAHKGAQAQRSLFRGLMLYARPSKPPTTSTLANLESRLGVCAAEHFELGRCCNERACCFVLNCRTDQGCRIVV